ncbi:MAG: Zn-dependent hydrolase [Campylobacter sp.]|nr:Zn-dependent hydrolase [Campylobacter sp.]
MVNTKRFESEFRQISKFGALQGGGITRLAYSKEDKEAREYLFSLLKDCETKVDEVGNIFAKFSKGASNPNLPSVSVGSHIDSVPNGGPYDGTLGVMAGLEAIRCIYESGASFKRPLELIVFACEESSRFKMATVGSKIVSGKLGLEGIKKLKDDNDISLYDAMQNFGLNPQNIQNSVLKDTHFHSYLELHIEQGRVLEESEIPVGIVTGIAAPIRFELTINGRADHSGATPMNMRKDALVAASKVILQTESLASKRATAVATVGYAKAIPGVLNVIPGSVTLGVDLRDIDKDDLNSLNLELRDYALNLATDEGLTYDIKELTNDTPVKLDSDTINLLEKNADKLNIQTLKMPSGAGHDAMHMEGVASKVGMLFIPCKDGISHNIEESISFSDAVKATEILAKTMLDLANE